MHWYHHHHRIARRNSFPNRWLICMIREKIVLVIWHWTVSSCSFRFFRRDVVLRSNRSRKENIKKNDDVYGWASILNYPIPCGLVARIRRFHRRGRGSIPRKGVLILNVFHIIPCSNKFHFPLKIPVQIPNFITFNCSIKHVRTYKNLKMEKGQ